jgi:small-conductance mechanosensitive channel
VKTQIDRNLASYFDAKLKQVMEELSHTVNGQSSPSQKHESNSNSNGKHQRDSAILSQTLRKEKSQWSVFQLYLVCAEKVMGLSMRNNTEIGNTTIQVFKGLAKIIQKYQRLVLD